MTQAREGFPTAAQRLLSFLRLVAELGAKEGVFLQSTEHDGALGGERDQLGPATLPPSQVVGPYLR